LANTVKLPFDINSKTMVRTFINVLLKACHFMGINTIRSTMEYY